MLRIITIIERKRALNRRCAGDGYGKSMIQWIEMILSGQNIKENKELFKNKISVFTVQAHGNSEFKPQKLKLKNSRS